MILLPIGSVVLLEEAEKRLMIIGILQKNGDGKTYDYVGCPYPEGILDSESLFLFNHKDVKSISFIGFDDAERQIFMKRLGKEIEEIQQ